MLNLKKKISFSYIITVSATVSNEIHREKNILIGKISLSENWNFQSKSKFSYVHICLFFFYCISSHVIRHHIFTYVHLFIHFLISRPHSLQFFLSNQSIKKKFFLSFTILILVFVHLFFPHFIPFMLQLLTPYCYPKT